MKNNNNKKHPILIICILLCGIILLILILSNIPIQSIFQFSDEQRALSRLYIEIDKGKQGDVVSLTIEEPGEIQKIEEALLSTRLSFAGMYDGIEYCEYEGDWIIRISSDADNVIFIRQNGEVYSEKFKFMSTNVNNMKALYNKIISWNTTPTFASYQFTQRADVTHDGVDEIIIIKQDLLPTDGEAPGSGAVEIFTQNNLGERVKIFDWNISPNEGSKLYLTEIDGKQYVLQYVPTEYSGNGTYYYEIFSLTESGEKEMYKEGETEELEQIMQGELLNLTDLIEYDSKLP